MPVFWICRSQLASHGALEDPSCRKEIGRMLPFDAIVESSTVAWPLSPPCSLGLRDCSILPSPLASNSIAAWRPAHLPSHCTPARKKLHPTRRTTQEKKRRSRVPTRLFLVAATKIKGPACPSSRPFQLDFCTPKLSSRPFLTRLPHRTRRPRWFHLVLLVPPNSSIEHTTESRAFWCSRDILFPAPSHRGPIQLSRSRRSTRSAASTGPFETKRGFHPSIFSKSAPCARPVGTPVLLSSS